MCACINVVFFILCVTTVMSQLITYDEKSSKILQNKDKSETQEKHLSTFNLYKNINETRLVSSRELKGKGKKKMKHKPDLLSKILPMLIIPFLLQTAIIPMILTSLKFMLLKSALIGKIAIILGLINMFIKSNNQGGLYTHHVNVGHNHADDHLLSEQHYGYSDFGGSEFGAYINRK
ncbi:hypothetical protein RN001_006363 [Aquatica leii]|uniref:Uncharacterized protein n=1 Tax=Aquatica leii TaxID=1421715 RepID=A0AAN7PDK8_9COLE|nr:hypothetical protein RN001_006363 [Aquatica leii]